MGNTIGIAPDVHSPAELHMSNGGTCVLLDVLALSGVRAARTPQEKRLIVWLSEHDQSRWGLGAVGFDLCELPWDPDSFQLVSSSAESTRMNEYNTHFRWADRIVRLAQVYGVKDSPA